jgi:hypothetical protein
VFLDGQMIATLPTKATGSCVLLPSTALLKAIGLKTSETDGGLSVKSGDRTALFRPASDRLELNGQIFRMPAATVREKREWFLPDSVLAAVAGLTLVRDAASGSVQLTRTSDSPQADILWVEANKESDLQALRAMLTDIPGRREYWAAEGSDVSFEVTLAQPLSLKGVGIQWHQGATRRAKFALETSADGVTWQKVFEGSSSGKSDSLETYAFEPHDARFVRFRGFGNTLNNWNSLVHFRLIPAEPRP